MTLKELGRRLTARRLSLGLSREQVCASLGISWGCLQSWELGIRSPSVLTLCTVLAHYRMPASEALDVAGPEQC